VAVTPIESVTVVWHVKVPACNGALTAIKLPADAKGPWVKNVFKLPSTHEYDQATSSIAAPSGSTPGDSAILPPSLMVMPSPMVMDVLETVIAAVVSPAAASVGAAVGEAVGAAVGSFVGGGAAVAVHVYFS
jgi:hypothetical protein